MADFCLPPEFTAKFISALRDGTLRPDKLVAMESDTRREMLSGLVGEQNAKDVNALIESKFLLKNWQKGVQNAIERVIGDKKPALRNDIISKIQKIDKLLNPAEERMVLSDAAEKALGIRTTTEQRQQITKLAGIAAEARDTVKDDPSRDNIVAFGRAKNNLSEYMDFIKPGPGGWKYWTAQILNIPRTFLTSALHWSAPFVQGRAMMSDKLWWEGLVEQMRMYGSEDRYQEYTSYMSGHPDTPDLKRAGLQITDLSQNMNKREEALQSSLLEQGNQWLVDSAKKFGVTIPNTIRASSRSFTGFLDYVRFESALQMLAAGRAAGHDMNLGAGNIESIAHVVNVLTGRGGGKILDRAPDIVSLLNAAFFAPRKRIAQFERISPWTYLKPSADPIAKKWAARQMVGYAGTVVAMLGLARLSGWQFGTNPLDTKHYLQFYKGPHSFDPTSGDAGMQSFLAKLVMGQRITAGGQLQQLGYNYNPTRADIVLQYARGMLNPVAATVADMFVGKTAGGEKTTVAGEAQHMFLPITAQEFVEWAKSEPKDYISLLPALLVPLGLPMHSTVPRELDVGAGPVATELSRIGYSNRELVHPTGDPHFDELVTKNLGPLIEKNLAGIIQSPGYKAMSDIQKALSLEATVKGLSTIAVGMAISQDPQAWQKIMLNRTTSPRLRAFIDEQQKAAALQSQ